MLSLYQEAYTPGPGSVNIKGYDIKGWVRHPILTARAWREANPTETLKSLIKSHNDYIDSVQQRASELEAKMKSPNNEPIDKNWLDTLNDDMVNFKDRTEASKENIENQKNREIDMFGNRAELIAKGAGGAATLGALSLPAMFSSNNGSSSDSSKDIYGLPIVPSSSPIPPSSPNEVRVISKPSSSSAPSSNSNSADAPSDSDGIDWGTWSTVLGVPATLLAGMGIYHYLQNKKEEQTDRKNEARQEIDDLRNRGY